MRLSLTFETIDEALGPLLRLGAQAEVLAPEEMRGRILDAARGIVGRYAAAARESSALSAPPSR